MLRVVSYLNQFFGGLGGEENAGIAPQTLEKKAGPIVLLEQLLGARGSVVATVVCGDNYAAEKPDQATREVVELILGHEPDLVVLGPAFSSGRYGIACARITAALTEAGIPAVTGLHPENPGVDTERASVFAVPVAANAAGMRDGMERMVALGFRLAAGEEIGGPDEGGYIPRGVRRNVFAERNGAERAVELLIKKLRGEAYESEIPLPKYDRVSPTALSEPLADVTLAIVTEAGVVPMGNPDRLESARSSHWFTYPIEDMVELSEKDYQTVHGGFDNARINEDPNRAVPLDALRELEQEGVFARLHPEYYVTTGMTMPIAEAERIGQEIADSLRKNKIHAALVTST